jgi:hypothetical protein
MAGKWSDRSSHLSRLGNGIFAHAAIRRFQWYLGVAGERGKPPIGTVKLTNSEWAGARRAELDAISFSEAAEFAVDVRSGFPARSAAPIPE